ncbi:MAG: type I methionyl aminopeptidase [Candidatus Bipolaricaulota bacterium]|nr:type I methionyl aminopeptidase [Candidatus Bipolaricaulota bacterium]MCS7275053.1 type I methionyl aminopeptidase [Candidatus Bipolaricaulota bacterium]MDW8110381.1 type I methionyl aminopeptidase [Candidatus Bipolaricaulota bacterium]MDW8329548.1 type I methionyl aminopeptidase [Candidatus Bipolaricaulota bacterium]
MIRLKSQEEIAILRENAELLQAILRRLIEEARPGVATLELDRQAERWIAEIGGRPTFKGYRGYPATICTSLNAEVVHGIPSAQRLLKSGDVLSIDIGMRRKGFCADLATTVLIGGESDSPAYTYQRRVMQRAAEALQIGIEQARAGRRVGDISSAIQRYINSYGLSVVTNFVGHGIGREMHEEPPVPNYGTAGQGPLLREGMVLCIEPMVADGPSDLLEVEVLEDGWTARAPGATVAAHYEAMVLVGAEPVVLGTGLVEPQRALATVR